MGVWIAKCVWVAFFLFSCGFVGSVVAPSNESRLSHQRCLCGILPSCHGIELAMSMTDCGAIVLLVWCNMHILRQSIAVCCTPNPYLASLDIHVLLLLPCDNKYNFGYR